MGIFVVVQETVFFWSMFVFECDFKCLVGVVSYKTLFIN